MSTSRMHDLTVGAINAFQWSHYGINPLADANPSTWPDDLAEAILNLYQTDGEVDPDNEDLA